MLWLFKSSHVYYSIGLISLNERDSNIVAGVIWNLVLDESMLAIKWKGCYYN